MNSEWLQIVRHSEQSEGSLLCGRTHDSPSPPALSHRREREPVEESATRHWRTLEAATHKPGALGSLLHKRVYTHTNGDATPDAWADYTYGYDAVGNVYCAWDDDGNEVFYFAQDAFGNELPVDLLGQDSWADARSYGINEHQTGKWLEPFTGLYYFHARFYDPVVGRFVGRDPALRSQNPYLFAAALPTFFVDLSGDYNVQAYEIIGWEVIGDYAYEIHKPRPDIEKDIITILDAITASDSSPGYGQGFPCCSVGGDYVISGRFVCERNFHNFAKKWIQNGAIRAFPVPGGFGGNSLGFGIILDLKSVSINLLIHELLHKYMGTGITITSPDSHAFDFYRLVDCVSAKVLWHMPRSKDQKYLTRERCCP